MSLRGKIMARRNALRHRLKLGRQSGGSLWGGADPNDEQQVYRIEAEILHLEKILNKEIAISPDDARFFQSPRKFKIEKHLEFRKKIGASLALGNSIAETARQLGISQARVKRQKKRVLR